MSRADALREGAAAAELHALKQSLKVAKAKSEQLQARIKDGARKIKETFAKVGFHVSDDPTPEEIQNGLAFMEAFNVRSQQIAEDMVRAMGFEPKADSEKKKANRSR